VLPARQGHGDSAGDAVGADLVLPEFEGERLCQAAQAMLVRVIGRGTYARPVFTDTGDRSNAVILAVDARVYIWSRV
jgi:hypothetical protein